jgi:hyperosmotically inducible periplasmic protein
MKKLSIVPAAILALAIGTTACTTGTENDPSDRVEQALEQANVEGVNVDYDSEGRVVHLKGQVQSADEKQRAEEIATTAVGTSGTVLNELMVEGMDEDRIESADDQLKTRLNDSVQAHQQLSDQTIDFYVNNGVVTITGEVQTAAQKEEVGRMVKETPGVEDFANELRVANEKPRR